MAKWGEGDPRWIVEERPDATNVNNWHWTEKNASHWSKEKLKALLVDQIIEDPGLGRCILVEMTSCNGEAVANNRKGKLIFFYEWEVEIKWVGRLHGSSDEYTGKVSIPNLSEENTADEITFNISSDQDLPQTDLLKNMIRTVGNEILKDKMRQYINDLRNEFAKDMIKPTKLSEDGNINIFLTENQIESKKSVTKTNSSSNTSMKKFCPESKNNDDMSQKTLHTTSIRLSDHFKCQAKDIYEIFTESHLLQAFTQNKVENNPSIGEKFSLLGGNIVGTYTYLEPYKCIKQNWRISNWPEKHFSEVVINFDQKADSTEILIEQNGVPETEYDRTIEGWKRNYLESIKRTFGIGYSIY
ncbi:Activator of 90 kDa heat shock protein ATPase -like protein 1 [Sarcoptes scabiei]|uniref:Activator of 90 kDa heat shock protein ATPase -like protein 1 n=1 Tax=Sarcoptes scabiei TaxID=52283 RepID=A0A132A3D4_SARSC|nr:Activator of 90 kDa heat shock protein ATPase -like protein 1 [Sarcoptes scabiei]KPM05508.1 activator of 90 kDa heat shock protein ATPase 1-like protein [Sarcoptes scabiei]